MARATLPADDRSHRPLWFNISFLLMWSSVAASGFGDRVINLVAVTLLGGTGRGVEGTSITAGLSFWFFLPYLLLGIPAGWLADKLPRKWIMLTCDESRALVLLVGFILLARASGSAVIPEDARWQVFATIAAVGVFAAIFNPARNATVPQIVPLKQLQSANALILGIAVIANLFGLILGIFLVDPNEPSTVRTTLIIGVLLFAVSGTFFAFLDQHRKQHGAASGPRAGVEVRQITPEGACTDWPEHAGVGLRVRGLQRGDGPVQDPLRFRIV